jgi:Sigma-70, region 4
MVSTVRTAGPARIHRCSTTSNDASTSTGVSCWCTATGCSARCTTPRTPCRRRCCGPGGRPTATTRSGRRCARGCIASRPTCASPWPARAASGRCPPAAIVGRRDELRLAVVAAMRRLPARQRTAVILREALDCSAAEIAAILDTSPAAVNSALQRARSTLATGVIPPPALDPDDADCGRLVEAYVRAFERADVAAITELLTVDVMLEMPPVLLWFHGDVLRPLPVRGVRAPRRWVVDGADPGQRAAGADHPRAGPRRCARGTLLPGARRPPRTAAPATPCSTASRSADGSGRSPSGLHATSMRRGSRWRKIDMGHPTAREGMTHREREPADHARRRCRRVHPPG